jgi:hypothetical protein
MTSTEQNNPTKETTMSGYKSHTREEISAAIADGKKVWALDTGNDGLDDTLIGDKQDIINDVLFFHDLDVFPSHWTLDRVS